MSHSQRSVILAAARTPIGSFQGAFASMRATALGGCALRSAVERSGLEGASFDEAIMGCVLTACLGQSPARQALLEAGLPQSVGACTVNRVCSSGLKAVMFADQMIRLEEAHIVAAGGMESMTNAPYCLPDARGGMRLGDRRVVDSMVYDGLWDYPTDQHMGSCAELCAGKYGFTRDAQDAFARRSYERAQRAIEKGAFKEEIAPVTMVDRKGNAHECTQDEEPGRADFEKMKTLAASFKKDGTITAANASSISDGAAALVVTSEKAASEAGCTPLATIVAHAGHSHEPEWFTTAPIEAIRKVLAKASLNIGDIELWEINEAFSCVAMAAIKELGLDDEKVNVNGGAVALGHPIGCSGARILVTLIHAMRARGFKRGLAALCNGGGEATAMIVELP